VPEALPLDLLTAEDFRPHLGTSYKLTEESAELELIEVTEQQGATRLGSRVSFSVLFRGPSQPVLEQRIRRLQHDSMGVLELFLVPIARDAGGVVYEAVFT
jgi:hypothetical protein